MRGTLSLLALVPLVACGGGEEWREGPVPAPDETAPPAKDSPSESEPAPHVVFILLDDLGWGDVGWLGSRIPTPEMDRLAEEGTRLDHHYTLPLCTPSRAALLTGRHPLRFGLQDAPLRYWHDTGLPPDETTLAELLREVGYRTHIVGKWHLGSSSPYRPLDQGFEHHYGCLGTVTSYYRHTNYKKLDWWRDDEEVEEPGYTTDLFADEAVRILAEHDPSEPLFLYVPFTAVHMPLIAPTEVLNHERFARFDNRGRRMHAAVTWLADRAIGRIVRALAENGLAEKTLLVVCSDNGAADYRHGRNRPLRDGKGSVYEGGVRVPALCRFPGRLSPGQTFEEPMHLVDWFPTIAGLAGVNAERLAELGLDGLDVWPALSTGQPLGREELLLNVSPYGSALIAGDWKLLEVPADSEEALESERRVELYHRLEDPLEENDRAAAEPEVRERLLARIRAWQAQAVPALVPRRRDDPEDR